MDLIDRYISYVRNVRRYSERTAASYEEILRAFANFVQDDLVAALNTSEIRSYEVYMLDDKGDKPRTVNLHLSVLSGFCNYLVRQDLLKHNPVKLVSRPKVEKRLPEFFRQDAMEGYFKDTDRYASQEYLDEFCREPLSDYGKMIYEHRLARLIIALLYDLGLRRSELIALTIGRVDFGRKVVMVCGKGNKMREIPLLDSLAAEIRLYLSAAQVLAGDLVRGPSEPLLITYTRRELYPVYVDRVVKSELGQAAGFTGRKSPHVLRHSVATGLLDGGAQLNSIKEMLGHSSLAATQVYTHNSISKLQNVYKEAHPRAKSKKE